MDDNNAIECGCAIYELVERIINEEYVANKPARGRKSRIRFVKSQTFE
jgi:hypothetical protein